jgi:hypothetical protein
MVDLYHSIADIVFRTFSDVEISYIRNGPLKEFQIKERGYNVRHSFSLVKGDTDSTSPLNSREKEVISRCSLVGRIDRSTLIIPPIVYDEKKLKNFFPKVGYLTDLNNPILQADIVRDKLANSCKFLEDIKIQVHGFSVTFYDYKNRTIDIFYSPVCNEIFKADMICNGIRRMFTSFLPGFSAAMIHSSALLINGKVGIFLAPDEGGKTTAAKLGVDHAILCDDQNIIKKEENEFIAYSTPWGHNRNSNLKGPVKGFFLLVKGNGFKIEQLKPSSLFSYLWNEHLDYSSKLPEKYRLLFFDFLYTLSRSVPGFQLTFQKDFIDWDAVENAMA